MVRSGKGMNIYHISKIIYAGRRPKNNRFENIITIFYIPSRTKPMRFRYKRKEA